MTDVVTQFMEKLEGGKLIRVDGKIGLFVFNGNFAQISESHKNVKFIRDRNDLEEDEEKLRMLYNFLHHGFAYSDEAENVNILKKYNLYGLENLGELTVLSDEFNLKVFYDYCLDKGFCKLNNADSTVLYTERGLNLLGEASQFYSFGRFSEEYLVPMSLKSKYESVNDQLQRMLSKSDSKDSSISRLLQVKEKLEKKGKELGDYDQKQLEKFENIKTYLKSEYIQWCSDQIKFQTNNYSYELIDVIIERIEKDINGLDFMKEIGSSMIPSFLKSNDETTVSKKIYEKLFQMQSKKYYLRKLKL